MLFSLYNTKTCSFMPVIEAENEEVAKRMFVELFNSPNPNQITNYIDEYVLYLVGDFDRDNGQIIDYENKSILSGLQAVKLYKERKKLLDELYSSSTITPSLSGDEDSKGIELFPVESVN